jgi:glycosyltransferase involved in cell wall biosynthesis
VTVVRIRPQLLLPATSSHSAHSWHGSPRWLSSPLPESVSRRVRRVSRHDLWDIMKTADVLLVPSIRDDGPIVPIEARALSIPVIALDQSGPADLAKAVGGSFVLVPLTTTKRIVSGLSNVLVGLGNTRPDPESITQAYGFKRVGHDLLNIYSTAARISTDEHSRR